MLIVSPQEIMYLSSFTINNLFIGASWPSSTDNNNPVEKFQILMVLSKEPEIMNSSLEVKAKELTEDECPDSTLICLFSSKIHIRTVASLPPEIKYLLFLDITKLRTSDV